MTQEMTQEMTHQVALCGAGLIAGAHGTVARHLGLPVAAVASRSAARAVEVATVFGARSVAYDDLPAGADIVVVATPPQRHAADAVRSLTSGAAVLLEKPLCTTLQQADQLVDAVAAHGGRLLYAENLAYAPIVQRLLTMVPTLGPLTHLEARALQGLPEWGDFTSDEWGGGALFDLGVHPLAIVLLVANIAGHGRPNRVSATLRGGEGHGSDEHADVHLHYDSGLTAHVVSSWQAGPAAKMPDQLWDVQVAGERGVVRAELIPSYTLEHNGIEVHLGSGGTAEPDTLTWLTRMGYVGQMQALIADTDAGREPVMSAAFGREVLQVVMAAYTSAGQNGSEVALPFAGPRDLTPLQLWHRAEAR